MVFSKDTLIDQAETTKKTHFSYSLVNFVLWPLWNVQTVLSSHCASHCICAGDSDTE